MKKTLFVLLTLLAALLVFVSCDESLDADVFNTTPDVEPIDYKTVPLTLEFESAGTVTISNYYHYYDETIYYSIDGEEKESVTICDSFENINVPAGSKISLYADRSVNDNLNITCNSDCYLYGNIMSLISANNYADEDTVFNYAFYFLFCDNTNIDINPEKGELVLPATTLAYGCYYGMFQGCTRLTTAPELPATILAVDCYEYMFYGCTSLTTAPALPATTLAEECYFRMFQGCTSLTTAPELPAGTLDISCYEYMFRDCISLTTAPTLPATTLANYCYHSMFYGCTSLTTAPTLSVTTLATSCYDSMFSGCTSLTTAPTLPATTLADYCYLGMFSGCTSLTTAPTLPAITLAMSCYDSMFSDCSSLNSITCLATNISATNCTRNWVDGVAATGTFTKTSSAMSPSDWEIGKNGIPSGWTINP